MKINLNSFLEPPHFSYQPERPASTELESGIAPLYDESADGQVAAMYGPQAHDGEGNSIAWLQIPYERIEEE